MIIDAVDIFVERQKEVLFDRKLMSDYGLELQEIDCFILIDDRMFAFIPEREG